MMDEPDAYKPSQISEKEKTVIEAREAVGIKFGSLMGDKDLTDEKISDYFDTYQEIHKLSRSKVGTHLGVISDPDFVPYWNAIETAYATFQAEENPELKNALQQAAQQMFGFHEPFDEFVGRVKEYKTEYMLSPFKGNGQIDDSDDPGADLTDSEWEELIK